MQNITGVAINDNGQHKSFFSSCVRTQDTGKLINYVCIILIISIIHVKYILNNIFY